MGEPEFKSQSIPSSRAITCLYLLFKGQLSSCIYSLLTTETFVLMEKFRALESSILGELKNQDFDVSNITQYIISLPFELKNEQKPDLDRLFRYLHGNIWSFINYTLLESIIRKFGSTQLQGKMEMFVEDITLFFKHTTVSQFNVYSGRTETPTRYCELMARLNADPRQCTLEQLHLLKRGMCQRFLPPHSEFAVMFCNCSCTDGGIELRWLIAIDLIVTVMTEFLRPENASFFEENCVENFQVRRITVYPDPNPGKFRRIGYIMTVYQLFLYLSCFSKRTSNF